MIGHNSAFTSWMEKMINDMRHRYKDKHPTGKFTVPFVLQNNYITFMSNRYSSSPMVFHISEVIHGVQSVWNTYINEDNKISLEVFPYSKASILLRGICMYVEIEGISPDRILDLLRDVPSTAPLLPVRGSLIVRRMKYEEIQLDEIDDVGIEVTDESSDLLGSNHDVMTTDVPSLNGRVYSTPSFGSTTSEPLVRKEGGVFTEVPIFDMFSNSEAVREHIRQHTQANGDIFSNETLAEIQERKRIEMEEGRAQVAEDTEAFFESISEGIDEVVEDEELDLSPSEPNVSDALTNEPLIPMDDEPIPEPVVDKRVSTGIKSRSSIKGLSSIGSMDSVLPSGVKTIDKPTS